ncbi:MAG: 2-hydroxyacyl-CoA dehydratase family protein [Proteobacteria bacterium]|nr:2-hydroxyacyl-CoA dehydratase family protein [Pseudomonadota bacterium]
MSSFMKSESGKRLTALMTQDYTDLHTRAAAGATVVWIAIVVPSELFAGFDNLVAAVPESHAAMCAGRGKGAVLASRAEDAGYSMDLCSYARIDIGTVAGGGADSPTFGLPRPHLLVSDTNNCALLTKWFDVHRRDMDVPHFVLDVPFCYGPQREEDTDYIRTQLLDLIATLEEMTGEKCDMDRVAEATFHTAEAARHWKRFLKNAEARPSGITVFDSFVQMAPFLTMRGRPELAEHFRLLADETEQAVAAGDVPVKNEKYRLLWDNIAPWHQLRKMRERLAGLGANVVAAPYTSCIGSLEGSFAAWDFSSETDPLRALARIQNHSVCPMGLSLRSQAMTGLIKDLAIDGAVFASNRSCKVFSLMQMDQMREIAQTCGIPTVMIDVDHADMRKYNEEEAFVRIEALLEQIDAQRAA